ncbi:MAG: cyclic nucleotide-binding domain-containing protein [Chitinispirillaceae bacterium]|nr:cyclic nucleotide-binding domain-containing protein [Chitinispirillaceae bacterium]
MIAYIEVPPSVDLLDKEAKALGNAIIKSLSTAGTPMKLDRDTDLFSCVTDGWVSIDKGIFNYYHRNKMVRLYETGDLLPLTSLGSASECRCVSDFGTAIRIFGSQEIADHLAAHPGDIVHFLRYTAVQSTLMHILCASYSSDDLHPDFTIRAFDPGTIIIAEGAPALEIYQMIQGIAVVTVKNVEVGMVESGEVFGEISFFTESARSATVTAKTECSVQVMRKDEFLSLAKLKPSVNLAISKTLSQRLVETNKKIAGQP